MLIEFSGYGSRGGDEASEYVLFVVAAAAAFAGSVGQRHSSEAHVQMMALIVT